MQYVLAAILLDRELRLSTFEDEAVLRPEARSLIERIHTSEGAPPPEFAGAPKFAHVAVTLAGGGRLEHAVDEAAGSADHPLSWDELADKYRDTAGRVLDAEAIERGIEGFATLEAARSVDGLIADLCPATA